MLARRPGMRENEQGALQPILPSTADGATASAFYRTARAYIETRQAAATRAAYTRDLEIWRDFCRAHGINPARAGIAEATALRESLRARGRANGTIRHILSALSKIYTALFVQGVVQGNPFHPQALERPPNTYKPTPIVPREVAEAMLASCLTATEDAKAAYRNRRDGAILALLYYTGLRRASIAALRWEGLRFDAGRLVLRTVVKGGREIEVQVPAEAEELLRAWRGVDWNVSREGPVFPSDQRRREAIHPATVNMIVRERAALVGARGVSPHQFRVLFITDALDLLPAHEVQAAVQHKRLDTTLRYDRASRGGAVADAVAAARREKS